MVEQDIRVPASYGDPRAEASVIRGGCALWDGSAAGRLEMLGDDRHRFLNGLITADVLEIAPGESCYGLFTSVKGRVLADVSVLVHGDRLWLRLPPDRAAELREHMEQYVITDRVEIRSLAGMAPLVLLGPQAEARLASWRDGGASLPVQPGRHCKISMFGTEVCVLREERLGVAGFSLWVSASILADFAAGLLESPEAPVPVGLAAVDSVRVEAGIPRFGLDFGEETFPQEGGVDDAVSYEKGCFLGQEVVARIHFRGGVHRTLRGLRFGAESPAADEVLVLDSRQVGRITSRGRAASGESIALALVANEVAAPGTELETAGGRVGRVVELPFQQD